MTQASKSEVTSLSVLTKLFSRMKNDEGGYMLITVIVILDIVLAAFVMVTFAIVERNYTAQVKQFSEVQKAYEERGEIEAAKGRIRRVAADLGKAAVDYDGNMYSISLPVYPDIEYRSKDGESLAAEITIPSTADEDHSGSLEVIVTKKADENIHVSAVIQINCIFKEDTNKASIASIEYVNDPEVMTP